MIVAVSSGVLSFLLTRIWPSVAAIPVVILPLVPSFVKPAEVGFGKQIHWFLGLLRLPIVLERHRFLAFAVHFDDFPYAFYADCLCI